MNEENQSQKTILKKLFTNGISVYLLTICLTFILNKLLNVVWLKYAPVVIVGAYIIWVLISIYNNKIAPMFNLKKLELLFYQVIIPIISTILICGICVVIAGQSNNFFSDARIWILSNKNLSFLVILFSIFVLICNFIAYERVKICQETKTECQFSDETIRIYTQNKEKLEDVLIQLQDLQNTLEKKSQVGYTATCIPIKHNKEHDTFAFVLIRNLSHETSQWMFPGSHVEVSENQLREGFELTDVDMIPGKVIAEKVQKEAGLSNLQFIDPYYDVVSLEETVNGKEQRSYPNTCYPAKAPIFNYLFRVSKSAKCYASQNHRCHYDFTYVGEYDGIDEKEAEYDVVEIEFNKSKKFESMERGDAIAHISSKLGEQINKKIKSKDNKNNKKNRFNTPFDQLCLDSIPEMIYNAILFYIDYKKLQ